MSHHSQNKGTLPHREESHYSDRSRMTCVRVGRGETCHRSIGKVSRNPLYMEPEEHACDSVYYRKEISFAAG
jgi:hypothetical protein